MPEQQPLLPDFIREAFKGKGLKDEVIDDF